jgi:hypothetical protein
MYDFWGGSLTRLRESPAAPHERWGVRFLGERCRTNFSLLPSSPMRRDLSEAGGPASRLHVDRLADLGLDARTMKGVREEGVVECLRGRRPDLKVRVNEIVDEVAERLILDEGPRANCLLCMIDLHRVDQNGVEGHLIIGGVITEGLSRREVEEDGSDGPDVGFLGVSLLGVELGGPPPPDALALGEARAREAEAVLHVGGGLVNDDITRLDISMDLSVVVNGLDAREKLPSHEGDHVRRDRPARGEEHLFQVAKRGIIVPEGSAGGGRLRKHGLNEIHCDIADLRADLQETRE